MNFPALIQWKIYTYNFISAIVAGLGSYKEYEVYGQAVNNEEIGKVTADTVPVNSCGIGRRYEVPYEVQEEFTNRAVSKFQNRRIFGILEGLERKKSLSVLSDLLTQGKLKK